jgi:hypothetical protein
VGGWVLGFLMSKGLKRYFGRGHLHFLTFSCYRRLPLLKTVRAGRLLFCVCCETRIRKVS